ncbi:MAG TPA: hypothetical protein QGH10_27530 [Armatimonadota bacterium]|nr:hypothetical protein [Armatimonadota bacterium]
MVHWFTRERLVGIAMLVALTLLPALSVAGPPAPSHDIDFEPVVPIARPPTDWAFNEYWETGNVGSRDFCMAAQGPYLWLNDEHLGGLRQVGLLDRVIPGHLNFQYIKYLLPEEREKLAPDSPMRKMIESFLAEGWPIHTIFYSRFQGNPPPSAELLEILDDQWIGDGQPETVYRLEPVFHYLKTGERWVGSSMHLWDPAVATDFFSNDLLPRLEGDLPFVRDLDHEWTRPELRRLSDLYCEEFYRPVGRALAWGMYVGNYHLASLPNTVAVGEKGADAFSVARLRGTNRQVGGGKFQVAWRGHEPTEMHAYFDRAWYSIDREEWGIPLPHLWYYVYRPYLAGINYYINEGMPSACMQDIEGDDQMELSALGHIAKDMLDFADRCPDRGVSIAPIALMLDYNRSFPQRGVSYFGYNLANDDADFFNQGVFEALFPEHRHAEDTAGRHRWARSSTSCSPTCPVREPIRRRWRTTRYWWPSAAWSSMRTCRLRSSTTSAAAGRSCSTPRISRLTCRPISPVSNSPERPSPAAMSRARWMVAKPVRPRISCTAPRSRPPSPSSAMPTAGPS